MDKLGNLNLHTSDGADPATKEAAKRVSEHFENARIQNKSILFLTSGGSAFSILDYISEKTLEPDITIGVLDERFDSTNTTNQFSLLKNTAFYNTALKKGCKFIDSSTKSSQTLEEFAKEFEGSLRSWKKENPDSTVIATIGMGPDGHTSGIMPFPEDPLRFNELFAGKAWVVGYDATGKNPYPLRATTTLTFLKTINHPVVYITGSKKARALCNALKEGLVAEIPAQFLLKLRGDVYIDESLYSNITSCLK